MEQKTLTQKRFFSSPYEKNIELLMSTHVRIQINLINLVTLTYVRVHTPLSKNHEVEKNPMLVEHVKYSFLISNRYSYRKL